MFSLLLCIDQCSCTAKYGALGKKAKGEKIRKKSLGSSHLSNVAFDDSSLTAEDVSLINRTSQAVTAFFLGRNGKLHWKS